MRMNLLTRKAFKMNPIVSLILLPIPMLLSASWGGVSESLGGLIATAILAILFMVIIILLVLSLPITIPLLLFYLAYIYLMLTISVNIGTMVLALFGGTVIFIIIFSHYMKWMKIRNFFIATIYFILFLIILVVLFFKIIGFFRSGM